MGETTGAPMAASTKQHPDWIQLYDFTAWQRFCYAHTGLTAYLFSFPRALPWANLLPPFRRTSCSRPRSDGHRSNFLTDSDRQSRNSRIPLAAVAPAHPSPLIPHPSSLASLIPPHPSSLHPSSLPSSPAIVFRMARLRIRSTQTRTSWRTLIRKLPRTIRNVQKTPIETYGNAHT